MGKPDLSVAIKLTPRQAVAILTAMRDNPFEFSHKSWRSIHNGAEARVRNALIDAGWREDGQYWVNDE